jgi:hypothetical protein
MNAEELETKILFRELLDLKEKVNTMSLDLQELKDSHAWQKPRVRRNRLPSTKGSS